MPTLTHCTFFYQEKENKLKRKRWALEKEVNEHEARLKKSDSDKKSYKVKTGAKNAKLVLESSGEGTAGEAGQSSRYIMNHLTSLITLYELFL